MKASELLADLIHLIAKHGDMDVVMEYVRETGVEVRSTYVLDGVLYIEPVDH